MEKIVLYPPQMEKLGAALAKELAVPVAVCTAQITSEPAGASSVVSWEQFPSGSSEKDPNIKVRVDELIGKHVILLMSQDDTSNSFAQLSLLLWLQRFYVPKPNAEHAKGKWKETIAAGSYDVHSVAALTVIIPWYRYCQMDRSCRWALTAEGKWTNAVADGPWIDVSSCHMYAALLSADPPPPPGEVDVPSPPLPPKELLLIDMHDDLNGLPLIESTLRKTGKWANPAISYDLDTGAGTYFASAFEYFLRNTYLPTVGSLEATAVVFPDKGAYRRFHTMVERALVGIPKENVLFIEKKRVGTEISQSNTLNYMTADGAQAERESLDGGREWAVLIPDDFTNSGSTLFGGGKIVKSKLAGPAKIAAYVSHFIAKYETELTCKFVSKLYSEDGASDLDTFYTTDSIPGSVSLLVAEGQKRVDSGQPQRIFITPLAPVIGQWVASRPTPK